MKLQTPDPILNQQEEAIAERLTKDYERFCKLNFVGKGMTSAKNLVLKVVPEGLKKATAGAAEAVMELAPIQKALEFAGAGFSELTKHAAKLSTSKSHVIKSLQKKGCEIDAFDQIPFIRSYKLEQTVSFEVTANLCMAAVEGGVTGAPGVIGIPFNLALSFFLYFRATQAIALRYGYDVKDNPGELAIASEVTLQSLEPRLNAMPNSVSGQLLKVMTASQLTALQVALVKGVNFETMAKSGGLNLLFVQLRAFGHASARKALDKSGQKSIEAGIFKGLLEKVGSRLTKQAGAKAVPFLGAFFGAGIDTYLMHRILTGANLIYHKRFLVEKAQRIMIYQADHMPTKQKRRRKITAPSRTKRTPKGHDNA
jgi:hypothetical protein